MVFDSFSELILSSWVSVAGTARALVQTSTWVVVSYCQTLCVGLTFHMPSAVPQQSAVGSMHRGRTDMQPLIVMRLLHIRT